MESKKILIIEDDPDQILLYREAFRLADFPVDAVDNGREGVEKIKKDKPDIVILDILMDDLSGVNVLQLVRENSETKNIPVLVLTNLVREDIERQVRKLGVEDYIIKTSVIPVEVVERVKKILGIM